MAMLPFVNNETCVCELVVIPACHHVDMKIGELDNRIDERKINIYNSVKSISDIGNVDYFIMTEGDSSDAALQFAVEQAVILAEKGCRIHCLFDIEKMQLF